MKKSVVDNCTYKSQKRIGVGQCGCKGPVSVYHCELLDSNCILKNDPVTLVQLDSGVETKEYLCCDLCIHNTSKTP